MMLQSAVPERKPPVKQTEAYTQEDQDQLLRAMFDSLPIAVSVLDCCGNVRLWNNMSEQLFGWKRSEITGNPLFGVPDDRGDEYHAFQDLVSAGKTLHVKSIRRRKDHLMIDVNITLIPLRDRSGSVSAILRICEGIGEPFAEAPKHALSQDAAKPRNVKEALTELTTREGEIVSLVLNGNTTKFIAQNLGLSEQGVRNHLHQIYRQLRVQNRAELMAMLLTYQPVV